MTEERNKKLRTPGHFSIHHINTDIMLILAVFMISSIAIISNSYYDANGYLKGDSFQYLRQAAFLSEGKGLEGGVDVIGTSKMHFSIWPLGYPVMIYILSAILGVNVFWASKVINIICVGLSLIVLRNVFKENVWVYGLFFLSGASLELFSWTWSEAPFILGMLWFCVALHSFLCSEGKNVYLLSTFLASLFLFLNRYIGAFSVELLFLVSIYYAFQKKYPIFIKTAASSIFLSVFIGLYLYFNWLKTGYLTGMPRISSPESNIYLLKSLMMAQITELNFVFHSWPKTHFDNLIFLLFLFAPIATFLFPSRKIHREYQENNKPRILYVLLFVGLTYWLNIVTLRWFRHFEWYSFRLLIPSTFLFYLAITRYFQHKKNLFNKYKRAVILMAILSVSINVIYMPVKNQIDNPLKYNEVVDCIKFKYANIEHGSLIAFGNDHLNYLRTDVLNVYSLYKPYYSIDESTSDFISRIKKYNGPVYFQDPDKPRNRVIKCSSSDYSRIK